MVLGILIDGQMLLQILTSIVGAGQNHCSSQKKSEYDDERKDQVECT